MINVCIVLACILFVYKYLNLFYTVKSLVFGILKTNKISIKYV